MATSPSERQRARRKRLREAGARELLVTLQHDALSALNRLCEEGRTASEAISYALLQSVSVAKPESRKDLQARLKAEAEIERSNAETLKALLELKARGVVVKEAVCGEDGVFRVQSEGKSGE